jgi:glutamine synthetase
VQREGEDGSLRPITQTGFKGPSACYDLALATESDAFLEPITRYVKELGWGLFSYDQECGRGQYELDIGYADALTMASSRSSERGLRHGRSSRMARSTNAVSTGLRSGPPAMWPQSESMDRSSACFIRATSRALSSGGK